MGMDSLAVMCVVVLRDGEVAVGVFNDLEPAFVEEIVRIFENRCGLKEAFELQGILMAV